MGTRCVALFGNVNEPRQWFPFLGEHQVIYEPKGIRLSGIEHAAGAAETALAAGPQPSSTAQFPVSTASS